MLSIKVPPLGESIVEATISRWLKKEGDRVASGETLVELETDKVTVEVPALKAGVLTRRAKQEGDVVTVNEVLCDLDDSADMGSAATSAGVLSATAPVQTPSGAAATAAAGTSGVSAAPQSSVSAGDVRSSPAARRLATDESVDLTTVTGTGRGGVVSKPDVVEHLAAATTTTMPVVSTSVPVPPAAAGPSAGSVAVSEPTPSAPARTDSIRPRSAAAGEVRETREKMTTRRRRIAEHLLESQHSTAHLTTFNEIDLTAVESLRARIKERIEKEHGVRLSMMPFFVKAACMALKQFAVVNAKVEGDHIQYHHYVNMGIAVASDAGLVVPNLKDADSMSLLDIARSITAVAKKARDGKLTMDDLTGGTFTITNGGVFGSLISTPIINFPQVGILGLHKTQDRAMVVNGAIVVRPMMYVALSYDHRIIDGQQAVLFLVKVKELMEDPALMVVE